MSGGWQNSNRVNELPRNWKQLRLQVLVRDGYQCTHIDDYTRCTQRATDVDHIEHGNNHSLNNLRSLCNWHHARKSSAEGNQSPNRQRETIRRPQPAHPGML